MEATQTATHECVFLIFLCGSAIFLPSAEGALSPPIFLNAMVIGNKFIDESLLKRFPIVYDSFIGFEINYYKNYRLTLI